MKIVDRDSAHRYAKSNRLAALIPAMLAVPLCLATACGMEDAPTSTATQAVGNLCWLERPLSWGVGRAYCIEDASGTIPLGDGEQYQAETSGGGGGGEGYMVVTCRDGTIVPGVKVCQDFGE